MPRPLPRPSYRAPLAARLLRTRRLLTPLLLAPFALAGCRAGADDGASLAEAREAARAAGDPRVIEPPAGPYTPAPVVDGGSIAGVVRVAGAVPEDSLVQPTMDVRACGARFVDRTIVRTADRLGGALVWLSDIRTGKPLPLRRRFDVTNVKCQLEPRVQVVLAGGTLNVRSADAVVHRTRIRRLGEAAPLAVIQHNDHGQVVPHQGALAEVGLLELGSDVHPWTRAWVAVLDHPYATLSAANGAFTLTEVPPGRYTLVAWHERFGRLEQPVTVAPGGAATALLTFGDAAAGADAAAADSAAVAAESRAAR